MRFNLACGFRMTRNVRYLITRNVRSLWLLLVDLLFAAVAPEDHARAKNEIQGRGHFRIFHYIRHFQTIQRHFSYIVSSGKK